MNKIEGLNSLVKSVFSKRIVVKSTDYGQRYFIEDPGQGYIGVIYIDVLKRGRVSIKIKHCPNESANRLAKAMWNWLYYFAGSGIVADAESRADTYQEANPRGSYVARLVCNKWW